MLDQVPFAPALFLSCKRQLGLGLYAVKRSWEGAAIFLLHPYSVFNP